MFPALLLLACGPILQDVDPDRALVSVERLWDRAEHQAFTDLCRVGGRTYVTFREGPSHVHGRDGVVRVLASEDGLDWRPVALLELEGVDLRDPKLSITPDGRVMVTMGGSLYEGRTLVAARPQVAFSDREGRSFGPCQEARFDPAILSGKDWLWRVTWEGEVGYGVVYQAGAERGLTLVATRDGLSYEHVADLDLDGRPNETTLRLRRNGEMIALVRRESGDKLAMVGTAPAPYTHWSWQKLPVRVGGPNFILLPGGELLAAGREYTPEGSRTLIARMDTDGTWAPLLRLPSGGDTSYPGLLLDGERLWCSYYSGHEGKTSIYLARLRLQNLLALE